jgi:hypothetical protein
MKQILQLLSILILVGLACYFSREFFPKVEEVETVRIDTVWKYKIIKKDSIVTKLVPKYIKVPGEIIYVPTDCDSLKMLYLALYNEHFSLKGYNYTYPIDTIGEAKISLSMSANTLDTLGFNFDIKIPEREITITKIVIPNNWYLYGETNFNSLSIGTIHTRKDFVYKATYNINEKSAQVGVGIKINRLWK